MSNPYEQQGWSQQPGSPYGAEQPHYGQPSPQQPVYGTPYAAYGAVDPNQIRSNSTIVLVLGILGIFLIGLFGSIPAWVWGNSLIRQGQEAGLPDDFTSNARAGRILGIVGTVLHGLAILFIVAIFFFAVIVGLSANS